MRNSGFNPRHLKVIPINYLPLQVDLADLKSNGLLITDEEKRIINEYHRVHLFEQGGHAHKLSKKKTPFLIQNNINHSFVLFEDAVYVQYKGKKYNKSLGKGAFGSLKLLQNINTGEWVAKKNLDMTKTKRKLVRQEAKMNRAVNNVGEYLFESASASSVEKASLVMKLEPGINLKEAISTVRDDMSPSDLLRVCESMFACVNQVHFKKLLHRDVKLENFILNRLHVRPVDFGFTAAMNDPNLSGYFLGTPAYKSREIAKKYTEVPSYSTRSDGCALAICMQKWFDLDRSFDENGAPIIIIKRGSKFKKLIRDERTQEKIKQLILELSADDINVRMDPSVGEKMLRQIRNELAFSKVDSIKIAVLNLEDYTKMSNAEKELLLVALKQFDEVVLAANAVYKLDDFELSKMQRYLGRNGINCSGCYAYNDNSRNHVLDDIKIIMDQKDSSTLFHIMQVSTPINFLHGNTDLTGLDQTKRLDLNKEFKSQDFVKAIDQLYSQAIVTSSDINKITSLLERELARLKGKSQTDDVKKRKQFIEGFVKNLAANASSIDYTLLYKQLSMLEDQLKKVKRHHLVPLLFQTNSQSVKEVKHVKAVIAPQACR